MKTQTLKHNPAATQKPKDKNLQEEEITQRDKLGDNGKTGGQAKKPPTTMSFKDAGQGRNQSATWADRVRVTNSTTRHTLDPVPHKSAGSRLKVPVEMLQHNMDHWVKSMIGFFIGCRLPYHAVNLIAKKAWTRYGLEQVLAMDDGFLIFRFKNEEAITEVIEKGLWMFGGKNIILQKWSPTFQFDRSKISKLSVWIRLKGLPLPLWTKQGLSMAASMVGKPLSCDEMTISCRRLDYAGLPFIHHFEMDSPLLGEPLRKEEVSTKGKQKEDEKGQGNQQAPVSSGEVTVPLNNDVNPKSGNLRGEGSLTNDVNPKQDKRQMEVSTILKINSDITHNTREPKGKG
ncbi:GLYCINE-RICH CELL WALL STRUCTURAL PROTEIN 1.8-LIKE [Salix viminalis]|uniref:GLYCINE-RICH CELL WALL STRUCTURAL PROTEIN 1.8-LIKE n=1 Tax=Salix viminalis TaxID=40686 RepID=A0A9Q0NIZ2_SALVM|nr:GLYCINE-RICH CELL WALL STRUCTURAL PROTEIN 1.8-LIKE [Salix viminalis]